MQKKKSSLDTEVRKTLVQTDLIPSGCSEKKMPLMKNKFTNTKLITTAVQFNMVVT